MSIDTEVQAMIAAAVAPLRADLDALAERVAELETPQQVDVGWAEWYWEQHPSLDPRRMKLDHYVVVSAADAGPGTLRDALSRSNRRISFDRDMTIALASDIVSRADNIIYDNSDDSAIVTGCAVKFEGTGYVFHRPVAYDSNATAETDNWTLRGRSDGPTQAAIFYDADFQRANDGGLDVIYSYGRDVYVSIWDSYFGRTDKALLIDGGGTQEGGRYHVTIGRTTFYDCGQRQPGARNADVHLVDCLIERYGDHIGAGGGAKAFAGCNLLAENVTVIPRALGEVVGFNGQTCTKPRVEGVGPHFTSPGNVRALNCAQGAPWIVERNPTQVADPPYR